MMRFVYVTFIAFLYGINMFSQDIEDRTRPISNGRLFESYEEFPIQNAQIGPFVVLDSLTLIGSDSGNGWLYRSTDAGKSWNLVYKNPAPLPENIYSSQIFDMIKLSDRQFIAVGGKGRIIRTADRGDTWNVDSTGYQTPLQYIDRLDQNHAVVGRLPDGSLLHTSNAGVKWDTLRMPQNSIPLSYGLTNLIYPKQNKIIANFGFKDQLIQLKTSDLGQNWEKTDISELKIQPGMLFTYNKDTLMAFCYSPVSQNPNDPKTYDVIIRSYDLGNTWHYVMKGGMEPYWGLSTLSNYTENFGITIATGGEGKVYVSTDEGTTWFRESSPFQKLVEERKVSYARPQVIKKNLLYTRFINSENNSFVHVKLYESPIIVSNSDDQIEEDRAIKLLPNPASDFVLVQIQNTTKCEVIIINTLGEIVRRTSLLNREVPVSIMDLEQGVYTVIIQSNSKNFSKKLAIVR